jgi:8-hydroxy-5-deazaflavin:NADPH oxidoreductase
LRIAVLGKGMVGGALGRRWAAGGHEVTFGVRDTTARDARTLAQETGAPVLTLAEAVVGATVVVLAVPWSAVPEVLEAAGDLDGVVLIDTTNASGAGYRPAFDTDRSGAESIASLVPGARVVKAFNGMSYRTMEDPAAFPLPPALLLAGDDQDAKDTVAELAAELGLEPVDAGPLAAAVLLEYTGLLWVRLAFDRGMGRDFAIAIARRDAAS